MKHKIGFVLGRETALSVAEISAVMSRKRVSWQVYHFQSPIFILESDEEEISKINIEELGGTVKIFEIVSETKDVLSELTKWELSQQNKRVNFGLSFYQMRPTPFLGKELKKHYLSQGLKARHVVGKMPELSSVIVNENKLIERGFEAIIIRNGNSFILGRTKEVQNYRDYSRRDFGRPARDDARGMLPPKLAKIMVNLAGKDYKASVYDPFCGSGTVLQEAALLGYKNLFASDYSDRAIADTRANLNWLEQFGLSKKVNVKIFRNDILNPQTIIQNDAIVSEGYLGQPITRNRERAQSDISELSEFYTGALKNLKKMLKPEGILVLAVPFFIVGKERFYLPSLEIAKKAGLILSYPQIPLELKGQKTLTYSRREQFVGREILVFKNK
jgi:tRNA G10  N-methylase Trm11